MCASCGCGEPNEQHDNQANITQDQIDGAAAAAGISREQVMENLNSTIQTA